MKLRHPFVAASMLGAVIAPGALIATTAAAQSPTQLWVTNAYTYGAGHSFDYTICLDGEPIAQFDTTETVGPIAADAGDHEVEAFSGTNDDCTGEPGFIQSLTIPEGAASTLALWWPSQSGGKITVFPEDLSCVQAGTGRVTFRNLAASYNSDAFDLASEVPATTLVADVAEGESGSATLAASSYGGAGIVDSASSDMVADVAATLPISETSQKIVYSYGGNDGDIGAYVVDLPSSACEQPTTSTPTTTTVPATVAAVATPVVKQPTFTG